MSQTKGKIPVGCWPLCGRKVPGLRMTHSLTLQILTGAGQLPKLQHPLLHSCNSAPKPCVYNCWRKWREGRDGPRKDSSHSCQCTGNLSSCALMHCTTVIIRGDQHREAQYLQICTTEHYILPSWFPCRVFKRKNVYQKNKFEIQGLYIFFTFL